MTMKASVEKPWLRYYEEDAINAKVPQETIYEHIRKHNDSAVYNDTAINYFDRKISYRELFENIDQTAGAFSKLGIKKGDYVGVCSVTIPEMAYCIYGLNKIGAAAITLDPRRNAEEIKTTMDNGGCRILVILDVAYKFHKQEIMTWNLDKIIILSAKDSMPVFTRIVSRFKMPTLKIEEEQQELIWNWKTFISTGEGVATIAEDFEPNTTAAVTLTGGTTGAPKGVMLSNEGFNAIALDFANCGVPYTREHRFMDIIPAFSSYGIAASLHMPLSLGLEIVMIPLFNSDKVGHYFKKYKPSHTLMVPAHYEKLMNSKEMRNFDLSFLKTAGSGGDTMNVGLETKLNEFLKEHGCEYPLSQGYGMSEMSSAVSCCCNGIFKSQSVGYPLLKSTVAVFKPGTTEELEYGKEGELCMTGPANMLGYLNDKEESEKVLIKHPDGNTWVHSGDIGYIDEEGFVFIKGRIKRMITKFDGHKLFPAYIEGLLAQNEEVLSCAVVGVKDATHAQGEIPVAVVQLKSEASKDDTYRDLLERIKKMEERGRPDDIVFTDDMPHTSMGKIDYSKVAEEMNLRYAEMVAEPMAAV